MDMMGMEVEGPRRCLCFLRLAVSFAMEWLLLRPAVRQQLCLGAPMSLPLASAVMLALARARAPTGDDGTASRLAVPTIPLQARADHLQAHSHGSRGQGGGDRYGVVVGLNPEALAATGITGSVPCSQCGCGVPSEQLHRVKLQRTPRLSPSGPGPLTTSTSKAHDTSMDCGSSEMVHTLVVAPFCSQQCERDFSLARSGNDVRRQLRRLEHGVC